MKSIKIKLAAVLAIGGFMIGLGGFAAMSYAAGQHGSAPVAKAKASGAWPLKQKPSVAFLLAAWEKADKDAREEIKSYQIDGEFQTIAKAVGQNPSSKSDENGMRATWICRQQGQQYYFSSHVEGIGNGGTGKPEDYQHSFDGANYYYRGRATGAISDEDMKITLVDISHDALVYGAWPCGPRDLYSFAWMHDSAQQETDAHSAQIEALIAIYEKFSKNLIVSGPETVDGHVCYALNLDPEFATRQSPSYCDLPYKVYFAYVAPNALLPVRQDCFPSPSFLPPGANPKNSVFTYTTSGFTFCDGKHLLPTHWNGRYFIKENQQLIAITYETQLKWSRINDTFKQSDFQVAPSQNVQVLHNP